MVDDSVVVVEVVVVTAGDLRFTVMDVTGDVLLVDVDSKAVMRTAGVDKLLEVSGCVTFVVE